jgi:hypothetical protein
MIGQMISQFTEEAWASWFCFCLWTCFCIAVILKNCNYYLLCHYGILFSWTTSTSELHYV